MLRHMDRLCFTVPCVKSHVMETSTDGMGLVTPVARLFRLGEWSGFSQLHRNDRAMTTGSASRTERLGSGSPVWVMQTIDYFWGGKFAWFVPYRAVGFPVLRVLSSQSLTGVLSAIA